DHCRYELAWWGHDEGPAQDTDAIRARTEGFFRQIEDLHRTASELAGAEDVDTVLAKIIDRVAVAVDAPTYLLVVRTAEGERPRPHPRGSARGGGPRACPGPLPRAQGQTADPPITRRGARPTLPSGSPRPSSPRGPTPTGPAPRLPHASARHAAAAIEAVASL